MIEIAHLSKAFDGQVVLDDLNLHIDKGEILAILGESGTGKSVLLKNMMGLVRPDSGSIVIDGKDITKLSEREMLVVRREIGYLFQEGALYDFMTVFENLAFPLKEHTSMTKQEIEKKVFDTLSFVDLEGVEKKMPAELSGGMKKRVGLARSIILECKIIFCDEPTSGLDPIRSRDISDLIKDVTRRLNCTTVLTSHDISNTFRIADRCAILKNGKLLAIGSQEELKASSDAFVKEFIS